jgi:predicted CXXCH cytochrome family protein
MGSRSTIACVSVAALLGFGAAAAWSQQNPYRLKDADQKKICLACHADFEQTLKRPFVHTAVSSGECSGCHDPHGSSHGKLLSTGTRRICATCHAGIVPAGAKSTHKVVADGDCVKCHDPHASANRAILVVAGNDLCVGCHKELGAAIAKARFQHAPVGKGCVSCHDPHGSAQSGNLLKSAVPALCVGCHKPDGQAFVARHMGYPVGKASCTTCHDPHGSSQPALLLDNVHPPLATRQCDRCHVPPTSASPFATRKPGFELCRDCHADMVKATLAKPRLHWAVADRTGCVNCHSPHASRNGKLLSAPVPGLCANCHADTITRSANVASKHQPVTDGSCTACHAPHSADGVYLLNDPSINTLCTTCHDYETHSAHPIGDKAVDQRNKNLRVDCLSCHTGHGTENKWMLLAPTNIELCTRCHKQFVR